MKMFESKSKIKVIIIGNDGISRKYWVEHDADFYDRKYKIDQDAIYQSAEGRFMSKMVPTIMFRANNVVPISYKVKPSIPDPDEMGMSISRAAWAIAELMRKKDDVFKMLITALLVIACIIAGAGAFFGYDNGLKLKAIQDKLNQTVSTPTAPVNPYAQPTTPVVQPTPIPMQLIPVVTPVPQLVV
jgi:hypothetical protein